MRCSVRVRPRPFRGRARFSRRTALDCGGAGHVCRWTWRPTAPLMTAGGQSAMGVRARRIGSATAATTGRATGETGTVETTKARVATDESVRGTGGKVGAIGTEVEAATVVIAAAAIGRGRGIGGIGIGGGTMTGLARASDPAPVIAQATGAQSHRLGRLPTRSLPNPSRTRGWTRIGARRPRSRPRSPPRWRPRVARHRAVAAS